MAEVSKITAGNTTYHLRDRNYCTCSTAAGTAAKTATLDGFTLKEGATVRVKFSNANTVASPTLDISGTGAKPIILYGTTPAGASAKLSWYAGMVVSFVYDGTNWLMSDYAARTDENTTYSAGDGLGLSGTEFSNTGVRSIATGSTNGTISVNTNGTSADVAVHGLGTLAYKDSLTASEVGAIDATLKGTANGVAELDATGKVPSTQLPSYVDDVIEGYYYNGKFYKESSHTTEITGETGKIYVDLDTEKTYRFSGSGFVVISETLALGETSSTAYRGDRGAEAYAHATDANAVSSATAVGLYKVGATAEGHISGLTAVEKSDITALGIPAQDTTYENKQAASGGTDVSLVTTGDKYNWNNKTSNLGTVTSVAAGTGLTGGTITESGTIGLDLKSATPSELTAADMGSAPGRQYAVGLDANGDLSVNIPWSNTWRAFVGATSESGGTAGYIPAPNAGDQAKFFRADGTWVTPEGTTYTGNSPISVSGTTISHDTSGVTAGSAGDTTAQTPTWGGTFKVPSATVDANGHLTALGEHTVTVPNAVATTTDAGLMSAADKTKVDTLSVVKVSFAAFSSLPQSVTGKSAITANHEVIHSVLSNPSAQTGNWTVTTGAGSVSVSGSISGSTTLTLYLAAPTNSY